MVADQPDHTAPVQIEDREDKPVIVDAQRRRQPLATRAIQPNIPGVPQVAKQRDSRILFWW